MYMYLLKGLTAGAADPDPIPSRHAPDSDHVRQLSEGRRFRQLTSLRSLRGSSGCLGGSFGASGEIQKQRLFSGSVLGWSWEAVKVFLEVWGDPWVSPARSECLYFVCFRRFSEMSCFLMLFDRYLEATLFS